MSAKPIQSPSYPSLSLRECIDHVSKIEGTYRTSALDREDAAKIAGYQSLSGPANKTLAAFASYGLVEPAGKGMLRVTPLAISIIHPKNDKEYSSALLEAAARPPLFQQIREQFPDLPVPPEQGVIRHLNRAGFNPSAVPRAAKAFLETARYVEHLATGAAGAGPGKEEDDDGTNDVFDEPVRVTVGDYVQWESSGVLQFKTAKRVRWVSEDGKWLAVEGSNTGIPASEVSIEKAPQDARRPPMVPPEGTDNPPDAPAHGLRKAVFPVSEGDVTFLFPETLSLEGLAELEAYLAIFLKKERRKASETQQ